MEIKFDDKKSLVFLENKVARPWPHWSHRFRHPCVLPVVAKDGTLLLLHLQYPLKIAEY